MDDRAPVTRDQVWVYRACGYVSHLDLAEDAVAPFTIRCQSCRAAVADKQPEPWPRLRTEPAAHRDGVLGMEGEAH